MMPEDSMKKKNKHRHVTNPMTVTYESMIIPGWGQLSNRQYWKIPIIYVGLGISVYSLDFAVKHYNDFRTAYIYRTDNDSTTVDKYDPRVNNGLPKYSDAQLKIARDYYRRNAEISVIFIAGFYFLNVIDAYVSSQLLKFDVTDDLSINIIPPVVAPYKEKQYYLTGINITF